MYLSNALNTISKHKTIAKLLKSGVEEMGGTVTPKPVLVFGPILSGTNFIARYSGAPGTNYTVEMIPAFPGTNWTKLTNMVAPAVNQGFGVGVFQLFDPIKKNSTNRFYRVVWPAY